MVKIVKQTEIIPEWKLDFQEQRKSNKLKNKQKKVVSTLKRFEIRIMVESEKLSQRPVGLSM